MRYLIKSQRDGWYFTGFDRKNGPAYGKVQEAKIYCDKYSAFKDLKNLDPCGQRIIAVTRVGRNRCETSKETEELNI